MYYNFVDRKLNIKDKQIKGRVVKIHRSPATVMGDESCNRPLLNTFTLVNKWEGTAIRLTPEPGDLSV